MTDASPVPAVDPATLATLSPSEADRASLLSWEVMTSTHYFDNALRPLLRG